jgi:putative PEP-CTERM system histidine kinase
VSISAITYGACGAVNLVLLALIALRGNVGGTARYLMACCGLSAAWSFSIAVQDWLPMPAEARTVELIRTCAWLGFTAHLLLRGNGPDAVTRDRVEPRRVAIGIVAIAAVATVEIALRGQPVSILDLSLGQIVLRMMLAVLDVLLIENLYRNTGEGGRWHIKFYCIAVLGRAVFDIFLYSDALLFHRVSPTLFESRGLVNALVVPLIAVSAARSRNWRVDIHVSREIVFHTATLVVAGVFLLNVAGTAYLIREFAGDWGATLQTTFVSAALLSLAAVLVSRGARSRIKLLVSRHFFSYRYDYRQEWQRFIDVLSAKDDGNDLPIRVIRAVANIVDSPAGVLWTKETAQGGFVPRAFWNTRPFFAGEPDDGAFVALFRSGGWIVELPPPTAAGDDGAAAAAARPVWLDQIAGAWLGIPLTHLDRVIGFIVVTTPRAKADIDWETYNLLRIVGRQAASYLAEEQAAHALTDVQRFQDYSKRFAFVVHDIKTIASQLGLIVANAEQHGDNPEFQRDVLQTVQHSLASMNKLMAQLKTDGQSAAAQTLTDPSAVLADLVAKRARQDVEVELDLDEMETRVAITAEQLRAAVGHILNNAIEVSPPGTPVFARTMRERDRITIEIRDQGPGMSAAFIRNGLFRPFQSTKSEGYGIGVYQSREIARAAGGDLHVISQVGVGTTMRMVLPAAAPVPQSNSSLVA